MQRVSGWIRSVVSGVLVASALCLVAAGTGDAAETKIRALSLARLPTDTTIEIRLPVEEGSDDLRLSVLLADHFALRLGEMGYEPVEIDGALILRFSAEEPTYAQHQDPLDRASLATGDGINGLPARVVPIADNKRVLTQSAEDTYRLRVSVARDRKPPLWTGYIVRSVAGAERPAVYLKMADELLAFWGRDYP